jgi:hypothetical protein
MQVDFGSLFFGEGTTQQISIINNGPTEAKYILSYGVEADMRMLDQGEVEGAGDPYTGFLAVARIRVG